MSVSACQRWDQASGGTKVAKCRARLAQRPKAVGTPARAAPFAGRPSPPSTTCPHTPLLTSSMGVCCWTAGTGGCRAPRSSWGARWQGWTDGEDVGVISWSRVGWFQRVAGWQAARISRQNARAAANRRPQTAHRISGPRSRAFASASALAAASPPGASKLFLTRFREQKMSYCLAQGRGGVKAARAHDGCMRGPGTGGGRR